jgi:hypothetical protein
MGKWTEQSFFKARNPNGQKIHKEMLNITSYGENASQNHSKITLHSCLNGHDQENKQL